jgi:hypothetical protein
VQLLRQVHAFDEDPARVERVSQFSLCRASDAVLDPPGPEP